MVNRITHCRNTILERYTQTSLTVKIFSSRQKFKTFCCEYSAQVSQHMFKKPVTEAKLDARPTGDQKIAGSSPTGSTKFFRGD